MYLFNVDILHAFLFLDAIGPVMCADQFDGSVDEYGAVSPSEFFAVVTESFFEKPVQMKNELPDLYQQLERYYNLDPAAWRHTF